MAENTVSFIIMGIVEGATEFLPVSSTFHLIQTANLLHLPTSDFVKLFEVAIQSGAVCALFFLFKREVWFASRMYMKLMISTIPALIGGLLLHDVIKSVFFESPKQITYVFIAVGIIFIAVEYYIGRHSWRIVRGLTDVGVRDAIIIGLAQMVALVPGVSRSGAVIVAMLLMNYRREDAATYSLALSIPTIFAASAYDIYKNKDILIQGSGEMFFTLVCGFAVAFIVGYFSARWFVAYLRKSTLRIFGIYRIVLGILLLVV